jgi:amidase
MLKEAWDTVTLSDDVKNTIKQAGERFKSLGAEVDEVSVPMHTMSPAIWAGATRAQMGDVATSGSAPDTLSFPFTAIDPPVGDQEVSRASLRAFVIDSEVKSGREG